MDLRIVYPLTVLYIFVLKNDSGYVNINNSLVFLYFKKQNKYHLSHHAFFSVDEVFIEKNWESTMSCLPRVLFDFVYKCI